MSSGDPPRTPAPLGATPPASIAQTSTSGSTVSTITTARSGRSSRGSTVFAVGNSEYAGQDPSYGVVIGVPLEKKLKYGVSYEDFVEVMQNKLTGELDCGVKLMSMFNDLKDPMDAYSNENRPKKDTEIEDEEERRDLWLIEVREWTSYKQKVASSKVKAYSKLYGQCTEALQVEIQSDTDYEAKHKEKDPVWLLKTIKGIKSGMNSSRNKMRVYFMKLKELMLTRQETGETLDSFRKRIRNAMDTVFLAGGENVFQPLLDGSRGNGTFDEDLCEQFATMFFLYQTDMRIYCDHLTDYEKADEDGNTSAFPMKMGRAYEAYIHHGARNAGGRLGRQFLQTSTKRDADGYRGDNANACIPCDVDVNDIVRGANGEIWTIKCTKCDKWGHIGNNCPGEGVSNNLSLFKVMLSQHHCHHDFNPNYFYLDSGANFSSTFDTTIIDNLSTCSKNDSITAMTNGGTICFNQHRTLKLIPEVNIYYNQHSVATVLALQDLELIPRSFIFYDSRRRGSFLLVFESGRIMEFKKAQSGLYYYDLFSHAHHEHRITDNDFIFLRSSVSFLQSLTQQDKNWTFLQTAEDNMKGMTQKEVGRANLARKLQELLGWPSTNDYKRILHHNLVHNCPINSDDVDRALHIYGEPIPILKGKTKRPHPLVHDTMHQLALPPKLHDARIDLHSDILFVNKLPFLLVKCGRLNYVSVIPMASKAKSNIIRGLLREIRRYVRRGMLVAHVHGDGEYDREDIPSIKSIPFKHTSFFTKSLFFPTEQEYYF